MWLCRYARAWYFCWSASPRSFLSRNSLADFSCFLAVVEDDKRGLFPTALVSLRQQECYRFVDPHYYLFFTLQLVNGDSWTVSSSSIFDSQLPSLVTEPNFISAVLQERYVFISSRDFIQNIPLSLGHIFYCWNFPTFNVVCGTVHGITSKMWYFPFHARVV